MPIHRTLPAEAAVHETGWAEVPGTGAEVTRLPLVDLRHALPDGTALFARLTYADALVVAAREGARLLAPGRIHDLRRPGVAVQLTPYLGTPTAETDLVHSERHDADVWRQLRALGWDGTLPVVGAGKHWVAGAPPCRSRLEGWDRDGSGPGVALWQPDAVAHNRDHHDDGTTTVLERPARGRVTGPPPPAQPSAVPPSRSAAEIPHASPSQPRPVARPAQPELMRGDRGPGVALLQRLLLALGFDLGRWGADGDFGKMTEAAVRKFQAAHDLPVDGIADAAVIAALRAAQVPDTVPGPPPEPSAPELDLDKIEMIQCRNYTRGRIAPVRLVVLHSTENPVRAGVARNVLRWFAGSQSPRASCHYAVGPDEVLRGVLDADTAWAAPGANHDGIQVEQVGQAARTDWERAGSNDRAGSAVLERSASLVAALCRHHNLPCERVDVAGLLAGAHGITTHAAVSAAYRRSDHQDPGLAGDRRWPWGRYLDLVRAASA